MVYMYIYLYLLGEALYISVLYFPRPEIGHVSGCLYAVLSRSQIEGFLRHDPITVRTQKRQHSEQKIFVARTEHFENPPLLVRWMLRNFQFLCTVHVRKKVQKRCSARCYDENVSSPPSDWVGALLVEDLDVLVQIFL